MDCFAGRLERIDWVIVMREFVIVLEEKPERLRDKMGLR